MSDIIRILPNHVIHKIFYGEVVQNTASVFKELLENALDAEAKSIQIILQDAGKSLIKVIDDGKGMSISDARMSFFRYATSKIKTSDDLLKIKTMGFRGEALASIATVCQVEMQTKRKEDEVGISLFIEGNKLKEEKFIQTSTGTTVTVKNIFYNVPARRELLRSNDVELRKIMEEFNILTIAYPKVRFILYNKINNKFKKYFDFPPVSLSDRIIEVSGKKINEEFIYINEQMNGINLKGYIVNPLYSNKSLKKQFIFVNNRFIKNSCIYNTVLNAFNGFLKNGVHPSYFLFFFMDPKFINFNINPSKNEIRFENESSVYTFLYNSIRSALDTCTIKKSEPNINRYANYNPLFNPKYIFNISTKKLYEFIKQYQFTNTIDGYLYQNGIFQLYKSYIISILHTELIIIDQHRAHKRIFYEYFRYNKNSTSQQLQIPISLFFSKIQINLIKEIKKYLIAMGFSISFTASRIIVEATPIKLNSHQLNFFFKKSLVKINSQKINEKDILEILANALACSIAIKRGFSLTEKDMNHIFYELFHLCAEPNYDPDGNKIFITLNNNFIIKKFNEL